MLDVMFEIPSRTDVATCKVTKDTVQNKLAPVLTTTEIKPASSKKKEESA
jgi:ATP-dependent Clp protease ATP-binding subunit ClpX